MFDIGVVHYVIRPEGGVIDAVWHSTRFASDKQGTGIARGDTSNGFPGTYDVTYYRPDGTISAELELSIEKEGEIYTLTFSKDGTALLAGIGLETPSGLAGGYRKLGEK
ncbi:MAG: hypothetical protein GY948_21590 [Alphaproteobacteria bacterium]|nr:hypothetical protein [Alphaproteobacteria bacterium]